MSKVCQGPCSCGSHGHVRNICEAFEDNGHHLDHDLAGGLSQQLCTHTRTLDACQNADAMYSHSGAMMGCYSAGCRICFALEDSGLVVKWQGVDARMAILYAQSVCLSLDAWKNGNSVCTVSVSFT